MNLFHMYTGTPCFMVLHWMALHRCCIFNNLTAIPSTSIKIMTRFTGILALLRGSGTKPAMSPRHARMHPLLLFPLENPHAEGRNVSQLVLKLLVPACSSISTTRKCVRHEHSGAHPRPTKSETPGQGLAVCAFSSPPRVCSHLRSTVQAKCINL